MSRVNTVIFAADSYIGVFEFRSIVHTRNRGLSLRHNAIVVDVVGQQTHFYAYAAQDGWVELRDVKYGG